MKVKEEKKEEQGKSKGVQDVRLFEEKRSILCLGLLTVKVEI